MKYKNVVENDKTWFVNSSPKLEDVWFQAINQFMISTITNASELEFAIDISKHPPVDEPGRKKPVYFTLTGWPTEMSVELGDGTLAPNGPTQSVDCILFYSPRTCNDCAQKRAGYHNAVIQLRSGMKRIENEALTKEILTEIRRVSCKYDFHGLDPIASIDDVPGGTDLKLFSKSLARVIMNALKHKYLLQVKESFKQVASDKETGGVMKRLFYGIRFFPLFPGDVIMADKTGQPSIIIKLTPDMVHVASLVNGHVDHVRPESVSIKKMIFQANADRPIEFQIVSTDAADGTAMLMRLPSYEEVVMPLPPWLGAFEQGMTITAFEYDGKIWLFPMPGAIEDLHDQERAANRAARDEEELEEIEDLEELDDMDDATLDQIRARQHLAGRGREPGCEDDLSDGPGDDDEIDDDEIDDDDIGDEASG
jgi:NMD protein affecting ribosome stability and mRNA decay